MGSRIEIPSYGTGFARCAAESEYPERWNGLVGAWCPFLGPSGSRLLDLSGYGNDGAFVNDPAWVPGGVELDGGDDYIDCGSGSSLDIKGSIITVSALVFPGDDNTNKEILSRFRNNADEGFVLRAASNAVFFFHHSDTAGAGSSESIASDITYSANQWYHVVGTHDGSNHAIYVNGVGKVESATYGVRNSSEPMRIGCSRIELGSMSEFFHGIIDNVLIYNRALIAAEIADHYANPHGLVQPRRRIWAAPWIPMAKVNDGLVNAGLSGGGLVH